MAMSNAAVATVNPASAVPRRRVEEVIPPSLGYVPADPDSLKKSVA
jgi:hypothetical protein